MSWHSLPRSWIGFGLSVASLFGAPFPTPYNSERTNAVPSSAADALKSFHLPAGYRASLFAAEPEVQQPIAMTFDARGRLWVAENYTYAEAGVNFATNLNDRVLIFDDRDGDGRAEERKVFYDRAMMLTSVELGRGGVYLMCPPRLLWIPDRNHDDVPDGEPEVVLDGFHTTHGNRHTFANGLKWGPDGWLWGRVGISSQARIGVPGTPENQRVLMNGGVWRFHPERKSVEAVAHGTTNPWGLDWNREGEPFFINTVIGHLWHAIPGAHFQRMHGDDVNPHSYGLIAQHADHYHFDTGAGWTKSRAAMDGSTFAAGSDALGGGHAHSGLLIYQGENWPAAQHDRLFTINLHGRRINTERLGRDGSGYVGRHEADLFSVGDPWFRGLDLIQGPDGGVFLSDWSDTGECHDHDGVHRTSGRIYKITYGEPKPTTQSDLAKLEFRQLLPLLTSSNEWLARQARIVMVERSVAGQDRQLMVPELKREFGRQKTTAGRLRIIWALNAIGGADIPWLLERIQNHTRDIDEHIRSWAVRLLAERAMRPDVAERRLAAFEREAGRSPSPLVRLYLASALQHLPLAERRRLALPLVARSEDAGDHNLPLLLWQGIEPLVGSDTAVAVELFAASRIPLLRQFISRRLVEDLETSPRGWEQLVSQAMSNTESQADLVRGTVAGTRGWRKVTAPTGWVEFSKVAARNPDAGIQRQVRDLNVLFGDGRALEDLRAVVIDVGAGPEMRRRAIQSLVDARADNLAPLLKQVSADTTLASTALVGLLELNDPDAPTLALSRYKWLEHDSRPPLVAALSSRPTGAMALLNGVANGQVPRVEVTPFHARQIAGLGDAKLTQRLTEVWGAVRSPGVDKRAGIDRFRAALSPATLAKADLRHGRQLYQQSCAVCHVLYGEGARVGPELTGSGRANLDYLLENMVDPSAVVPADFRMSIVTLKDGRVLNGIAGAKTERTLTLQGQGEAVVLEHRDIQSVETVEQSLMPEGVLEALPIEGARDLLAYLMHPKQVPLK